MATKTIHIVDKSVTVPSTPNYDRLNAEIRSLPTVWAIFTDLIATGEIPRYRGSESNIEWLPDRTIITTEFATRDGAEKWADWVRQDNFGLISIEVVEH